MLVSVKIQGLNKHTKERVHVEFEMRQFLDHDPTVEMIVNGENAILFPGSTFKTLMDLFTDLSPQELEASGV